MKNIFLAFSFVCASNFLFSQRFSEKIDSLIQTKFNEHEGPGGVFLISQKGKPVYEKAFGLANLELNIPLHPNNVFEIGSMTKQFTSVSILMLEQQGKLKVTDFISNYIPDYPNGNNITIHHLLTHTSGIKNFTKIKGLSEISQKEMTPQMMVDFFKNEPVDFKPGEKFEYNNSGYIVLGYIIEKVSGETYEDFIRKNIFEKIGMIHSYYASDRKVIKDRAYGYHQKNDGFVNKSVISFSVPYASGSLMSTLDDMLKWQIALNQNLLLNQKESIKAFTKYKLNNGEEIEYGYGWHLKNINGIPTREHGGSIFGFKSMGVYIPGKDIYVLGFSNCDCNSPTQVVKDIAELALKNLQ
ncbi:beta-lactamase family protein [Chryseobacterium daecheongense]|uniref:serine hydrolase domain-containing protein n=1 Tax=Chryseobacterium daecheongense TaxID=192389 RepID=UPI001FD70190|nr:serine hydrolase domain-containing protein [Chryseobacterium daecheongense]UOU97010.1 beta-lactamase family protein [Chryseobacterium daecheongense]